MRRLHLMEIAEQPWCPRPVRDGLTDYLQWSINAAGAYAPAAPILAEAIRATGARQVVDLCAGGGGPWAHLRATLGDLGADVRVRLTDLYPNHGAFARAELASGGAVQGEMRAVDAAHVPGDLRGLRTMFTAFHHFRPADARRVLEDAVRGGDGIAVFEATRRDIATFLVTLLSPLVVLLVTPAIRPFRWSRLFFTYLVPLIPLVTLFDGLVSCLRTYRPEELADLARGLGGDAWQWRTGEAPARGPVPVTWLVGLPVAAGARSLPDDVSRTTAASRERA